jgi:SNF2 family DNA or RNA helicase
MAPRSALDTWPDEVDTHLSDAVPRRVVLLSGSVRDKAAQLLTESREAGPGLTMLVTNHDVLSSSHTGKTKTVQGRAVFAKAIREAPLDAMVVDELHRAKGRSSNLSKGLGSISAFVPRRIGLTGTVAPHSPLDLFAQWRWLAPEVFGTSWTDFEATYAKMGGYYGKEVIGYVNLDQLRALQQNHSMVVRKADALDLPPVTERIVPVTLTPRERKAYDQMEDTLVADLPDGDAAIAASRLVQWLRLRQLTSGYVMDSDTREITRFGDSKLRVTIDLLRELTDADEKVVVFAHFRADVAGVVESATKLKGVRVEFITGDTTDKDRRSIRKDFVSHVGPMVIVAQMRTVSLAINEFVVASHGVFLSMSERRDDWIQAKDRLDRKGQTRPVTLHYVVVPESIDVDIMDAHRKKGSLEAAILGRLSRKADTKDKT